MWGEHFMETRNSISWFEVCDIGADGMDNACDIIALIHTGNYLRKILPCGKYNVMVG
jgi:hypothetical protein